MVSSMYFNNGVLSMLGVAVVLLNTNLGDSDVECDGEGGVTTSLNCLWSVCEEALLILTLRILLLSVLLWQCCTLPCHKN